MEQMMKCPHCGGDTSAPIYPTKNAIRDPEKILSILKSGDYDAYMGRDNKGWWITHGKGEIDYQALRVLIERGDVRRRYSDLDGMYTCRKTIDMKATAEYRKSRDQRRALVYTDGSVERAY